MDFNIKEKEKLLWFIVLVTLVGDLLTTTIGLSIGLNEANPIADNAIQSSGMLGLIGLKFIAIGFSYSIGRRLLSEDYRFVVPLALSIPWGIATISNTVIILITIFG